MAESSAKSSVYVGGKISAMLASRFVPGTITALKGNKPLSLRYSRKRWALFYASELVEYIEVALDDLHGWRELEIQPFTMLTFYHETLNEWQTHTFQFFCQERKGTLREGMKALRITKTISGSLSTEH